MLSDQLSIDKQLLLAKNRSKAAIGEKDSVIEMDDFDDQIATGINFDHDHDQ